LALPARHTGMKGAPRFGDEPPQRAVFLDEVMGADPGCRVAQPIERRGGALHPGVVQHQHVDRPHIGGLAAAVVVWRQPLADIESPHPGGAPGMRPAPTLPADPRAGWSHVPAMIRGMVFIAPLYNQT